MATRISRERDAVPPDWVRDLVDDIPLGIAVFDSELRYVAANPRWINNFRLVSTTIYGRQHDEIDPHRGSGVAQLLCRALAGDTVQDYTEITADAATQQLVSVRPQVGSGGMIIGVIATLHRVTESSSERVIEPELDPLTGVAGRSSFLARVRSVLQASASGAAIFLLDIDNFRGINNLYGTRAGDAVLKTIATRLTTSTRSQMLLAAPPGAVSGQVHADLVARLGGDEFAIVLARSASSTEAETFARRLLQAVCAPILVGEQRIRLSASVGYLITGTTHSDEDSVLRDLDVALQEAKLRGPNSVKTWEPMLTSTMGRRLAMVDQLHRAVDEGEFVLHYQPILNLKDGRVAGAEALLRWNHPSDGLVPPAVFLPLLEESGLIVPVGGWVIREVVRQMQVWQMLYGRAMVEWVSVNVSPRQFNDPAPLLATLSEVNDGGFPFDRLKLELTESAFMHNPEMACRVLSELREFGIRIALDDFGTGYSALGTLRQYAVDTIKIDCDFTARLDTKEGKELVLALLKIARIYGAEVVAEGVETVLQRDILREAGCGFGQGFLFAKPMDGRFFGAFALTHFVETASRVHGESGC